MKISLKKSATLVLSVMVVINLLMIFICASSNTINDVESKNIQQWCPHSGVYTFNDADMIVTGVYKGNLVDYMIKEIASFSGDFARIFDGDKEIFEGELKEGMIVKIYHKENLYGEYKITKLRELYDNANSSTGLLKAPGNSYGFTLPIDNMDIVGNVSYGFGSSYGGPDYSYPTHRGIDIIGGGNISSIGGKPIRAVAAGTVIVSHAWDGFTIREDSIESWGNYVKIDHGNGLTTLYAHMAYTPLVAVGATVTQGQVIGYVGATGNAFGAHLHLEVTSGGALVNPVIYLTGAPTYTTYTEPVVHYRVPDTFTGDVNGDGYDDIIEMRAENGKRQLITILGSSSGSMNGSPVVTTTANNFINSDPVFIGDVNGDGKTDVIVHFVDANEKRAFVIYTGKSNGGFNTGNRFVTDNTHNPSVFPSKFLIGDFNGDGKDDFLVQYRESGGTLTHLLYRGNSSGKFDTGIRTRSTRIYSDSDPIFAADVNGDGCCDIIDHWVSNGKRQFTVFTGSTTGLFSNPIDTATENSHNSLCESKFFIGDFNGDGMDDFLVHWSTESTGTRNLLLYRGTSSGAFLTGIHSYTGSVNISTDPIMIGDVNGDGIDDVIVEFTSVTLRAFNVYTGTSSGIFANKVITATSNRRGTDELPSRLYTADVTNDGRLDIIVIWGSADGSENVIVYKGQNTKNFSAGVMTPISEKYKFSY